MVAQEEERPLLTRLGEVYNGEKLGPHEAEKAWRQLWEDWGAADRAPEDTEDFNAKVVSTVNKYTPEATAHMREVIHVPFYGQMKEDKAPRAAIIRTQAFNHGNTKRATRIQEMMRAARREAQVVRLPEPKPPRLSERRRRGKIVEE